MKQLMYVDELTMATKRPPSNRIWRAWEVDGNELKPAEICGLGSRLLETNDVIRVNGDRFIVCRNTVPLFCKAVFTGEPVEIYAGVYAELVVRFVGGD